MGDEPAQRLGQRIRILREKAGMTQANLAEAAGMAVDAVSRIERGTRDPQLKSLRRLAKGLKCSLPELVDVNGEYIDRAPLSAGLAAVIEPLRDQPDPVLATAAALTSALVKGQ